MTPIALITGVSSAEGLGHETARQLIDKHYRVIVSARDRAKAQALADGLGAEAIALDVTDPASVDAAAARLDAEHGRLDVLINNAGAYFDMGAQPLDTDPEFAARALDTNLLGAWRTIRAFLPLLERGTLPCVVNVWSGAGSGRKVGHMLLDVAHVGVGAGRDVGQQDLVVHAAVGDGDHAVEVYGHVTARRGRRGRHPRRVNANRYDRTGAGYARQRPPRAGSWRGHAADRGGAPCRESSPVRAKASRRLDAATPAAVPCPSNSSPSCPPSN